MEGWEKAKTVSGIVAAVFIPLALGFVAQEYSQAAKERDIGAKYVELAIGILRSPPTDDQFDIRDWAVDIIDQHSGVKLSRAQKETLKRSGALEDAAISQGPAGRRGTAGGTNPPPTAPADTQRHVTVPNVRGLAIQDARQMFEAAGLKFNIQNQPASGIVNIQDPPAGAQVLPGTVAKVRVGTLSMIPRSRISPELLRN